MRFFTVAGTVYFANLGVLTLLVWLGVGEIVAQAVAIVVVTPLNFLGNKLWSFRR
jgi:putative flippase GtrA